MTPDISIAIPVYNEAENVSQLHQKRRRGGYSRIGSISIGEVKSN